MVTGTQVKPESYFTVERNTEESLCMIWLSLVESVLT